MPSSEEADILLRSPVRILPLVKYCLYAFALEAIISFLVPLAILVENRIAVLAFNFGSSIPIGWFLYKRREHLTFRMDHEGFHLSQGKSRSEQFRWQEFSRLSLVKDDNEDLYVRVHRRNDTHVDLPASKLKLDAFDFRWKVQTFIRRS